MANGDLVTQKEFTELRLNLAEKKQQVEGRLTAVEKDNDGLGKKLRDNEKSDKETETEIATLDKDKVSWTHYDTEHDKRDKQIDCLERANTKIKLDIQEKAEGKDLEDLKIKFTRFATIGTVLFGIFQIIVWPLVMWYVTTRGVK